MIMLMKRVKKCVMSGISNPHLFVLKRGSPENEERTMTPEGITTRSMTWELKVLVHLMIARIIQRACLLQTVMIECKVNTNAGN